MRIRFVLKGPLVAIAVSFAFVFYSTPSASGQTAKTELLWRWTDDAAHHAAVVQVALDGSLGTGVVVRVEKTRSRKDGIVAYVLTAYHVVESDNDRKAIEIRYRNGTVAKHAKILDFDDRNDIALIETWAPTSTVAAKRATRPATNKTYLEFVGLGGGANLKTSMRHFSSRATQPTNANIIYADATLLPGDSGGPVFNKNGNLVGIISGGWFWWDGGATTTNGHPILSTWPARASNVNAIDSVMARITELNVASR